MTDQTLSRVDKFLAEAVKRPSIARGNPIFALDATASREHTWDTAAHLQAQMFREVALIGSLDVQLVYFRGVDDGCAASDWTADPLQLGAVMSSIKCQSGLTQISRVLDHAIHEASKRKIGALVFVGDCCEEPRDHLMPRARRLSVPAFMFQEGHDAGAERAFREIAQLTRGAHLRFDQGSARQLGELLRAVAMFAVGGVAALERQGSAVARLLLGQIRK